MTKKRALIVTTVASTIDQFCMNDIELLSEMDYKIDVAANFNDGNNTSRERVAQFQDELIKKGYTVNNINFSRSPVSLLNLKAYIKIRELVSKDHYDVIHCHTPIAALLTRLAAVRVRKTGTTVIYTAHGFHFHTGAPLANWLIFYPIERWLSKYTDTLITINNEDYQRAKNSFAVQRIEYIPGVGIDTGKISNVVINRDNKRKELGVPYEAFVVLSVGQLNKNKNHETVIKAIAKLPRDDIFYLICGIGNEKNHLIKLSRHLGMSDRVKLLGYRNDVVEICKAADIFAFPSQREGLGIAALEAMAAGLPLATSNVHGVVDYSLNGKTGFTCRPTDVNGFAHAIDLLISDVNTRKIMSKHNVDFVKKFDVKNVKVVMTKIYGEICDAN